MKELKILEGNKLIAEFLGFKFKDGICQNEVFYTNENQHPIYLKGYSIRLSAFHSDWNWLMAVVEKIESMNYSTEIYSMGFKNNKMLIYSGGVLVVQSYFIEDKLKSVWNVIVEFIKWYNENKLK